MKKIANQNCCRCCGAEAGKVHHDPGSDSPDPKRLVVIVDGKCQECCEGWLQLKAARQQKQAEPESDLEQARRCRRVR